MLNSLKAAARAAVQNKLVRKVFRAFLVAAGGALAVAVASGGSLDKALLAAALAAGLRAVLHVLPINDEAVGG